MSDNVKPVSFKKDEQDLIEYMRENKHLNSFSYYVKGLIRRDMNDMKIPASSKKEEEPQKPKRNANFDF